MTTDLVTLDGTAVSNLLVGAVSRVTAAERAIGGQLGWVESAANDCREALANGRRLNSLGVLQGTGVGLDVAVGRLDLARDALADMLRTLDPDDAGAATLVARAAALGTDSAAVNELLDRWRNRGRL